jgi:hypothetical protein
MWDFLFFKEEVLMRRFYYIIPLMVMPFFFSGHADETGESINDDQKDCFIEGIGPVRCTYTKAGFGHHIEFDLSQGQIDSLNAHMDQSKIIDRW